ncbi:MAG: glutamine cyclotransferase, partial [Muribaculaceae bacterium]|nr:glutamine cyclotransferase [Muribaculaceae bacterium]
MKGLRYIPLLMAAICGCGSPSGSRAEATSPAAQAPAVTAARPASAFDADSAMTFLRRQVAAGPRVPGSAAHKATGDYLSTELRRLGADTVIEQHVEVTAWNGDRLPLRNILGR